ncbi:hypothetical protein IKG28_00380 [Candidatus Saccharibacteria bacterium]|nr:hypothetical protein [Candidatus Saccharibacteria bacterium]MBR3332082.1 hypothetical protein [Candidatus Saccharibacteria bacterium]
MAQAKKKTATKTAKKCTTTKAKACKKTCCKKQITKAEKYHVYVITAMGLVAGILLCANAAMMMA